MNDVLLKKIGTLAFSAMLVLSLMFVAQSVTVVSGNGILAPPINYIFIRNNGTVEPSTAPILQDGNTYVLTADMPNSSIVVQRDNIVIDGAGYGIHGHGTSYYDGITMSYRTNITIKNMDIISFGHGVRMDYASNNTITGNKMSAFTGVSLLYSDYNQIIGNVINDGYGVQGLGSNNLIIGNNFTSGGIGKGISMTGSNNTISQNTIRHEASIGIGSADSPAQHNIISNNTIIDGRTGILLAKAANTSVFGNIIKGKTDAKTGGLYISRDSCDNVIYENQFENNALAVSLGAQVADSVWNNVYNNTFYRNNFVNNTQNVWIAPGAPVNFWDDGTQGNYWSNLFGVDTNGDGVSEAQYVINENNTDHYPFMAPVDFSTSTSPSASPTPAPSASPTATPTQEPTPEPVPEFPSFLIMPLFIFATLMTFAVTAMTLKKKTLRSVHKKPAVAEDCSRKI